MAFWRFGTGTAFWIVVAAAAIVALVIAAVVSRIRIRVRYSRSGHDDLLVVTVRALYGAAGFQAEIPAVMIQGLQMVYRLEMELELADQTVHRTARWKAGGGESGEGGKSIKGSRVLRLLREYRPIRTWMLQTMKKMDCTRFRLDFRVGTGDAASTAVASGLLWSVYGAVIALAGKFTTLKAHPHGAVAPVYDGEEFSVVCETDFEIRLGTALLSVVQLGSQAIRLGRSIRYWRRSLAGS